MAKKPENRYRSSLGTDRRIVEILAFNKEFAQYDLPERIGKDYRTVLRRLQILQRDGLVRVVRTEKSKKGGIRRRILMLTEAGLLLALADENVWSNIDRVASNYRGMLPLIFGEWEFYMDNGLRNEIISRLEAAVQGFSLEFRSAWFKIVKIDRPDKEYRVKLEELSKAKSDRVRTLLRDIAPTFTNKVLGLDSFLFVGEGSEQQSFISKLIKNPRLEKYFDEEFQYWVRKTKEECDEASRALEWYQSIKKPR